MTCRRFRGTSHASKPDQPMDVAAEACVRIAGIFVVSIGRAALVRARIPASASQDSCLPRFGPARILRGAFAIILFLVEVVAPFPHVAVHVIQAPCIGLTRPHRLRAAGAILFEPRVLAKQAGTVAERILRPAAGAAGVFPLGLRGQSIPAGRNVASPRRGIIAGRQAFQPGTGVAVFGRVFPPDLLDGTLRVFPSRRIAPVSGG